MFVLCVRGMEHELKRQVFGQGAAGGREGGYEVQMDPSFVQRGGGS